MAEIDDGGRVYPFQIMEDVHSKYWMGLTRRDWLAGQFAPQLVLARMQVTAQVMMEADSKEMVDKIAKTMKDNQYIDVSKEAYDLADAMIAQSKVDK